MSARTPLPRHRSSSAPGDAGRGDYARAGDTLLPRLPVRGAYVYPDGWWLLLEVRALASGAPDVRHVELATPRDVYRQQVTAGRLELDDTTDKDLERESDELPGLTAQRLRELPVSMLAADLLARHSLTAAPPIGVLAEPRFVDADGTRWWHAAAGVDDTAARSSERATRQRRRTVTPANLEHVSAVSMAAHRDGQPFTPAVADALGVSPRTAETWVRRARDAGLPMPPDPRRKDPR